MRYYTVQQRQDWDIGTDPDVVLIKEGFCWPALFVPLLWLMYRLQFLGLLAYLSATASLSAAVKYSGMEPLLGLLLSVVLSLLVASLANDWRRWRLAAKGYELVAIAAADNLSQAEQKIFHCDWLSARSANNEEAKTGGPMPASALTPFATQFDSG